MANGRPGRRKKTRRARGQQEGARRASAQPTRKSKPIPLLLRARLNYFRLRPMEWYEARRREYRAQRMKGEEVLDWLMQSFSAQIPQARSQQKQLQAIARKILENKANGAKLEQYAAMVQMNVETLQRKAIDPETVGRNMRALDYLHRSESEYREKSQQPFALAQYTRELIRENQGGA